MVGAVLKISQIYIFGLYFFLYGIYSILLSIRFKHGKAEKKLGEIVDSKAIEIGKEIINVPVIKYEHKGKMYETLGYSNTFRPLHSYNPGFNDFVDIYYDEKRYPNFVFIDNGFKDYVKGIILVLIGLPFISSYFVLLYLYCENDLGLGFNFRKIVYCLPSLIIIFVLTIFVCLVLYKSDVLYLQKYSIFNPKPAGDDSLGYRTDKERIYIIEKIE